MPRNIVLAIIFSVVVATVVVGILTAATPVEASKQKQKAKAKPVPKQIVSQPKRKLPCIRGFALNVPGCR